MAGLPEVDSAPVQVDEYDGVGSGGESDDQHESEAEDSPRPIKDETADAPKTNLVGEEGFPDSCLRVPANWMCCSFPKMFQYNPSELAPITGFNHCRQPSHAIG